jgi:hypothetical protein
MIHPIPTFRSSIVVIPIKRILTKAFPREIAVRDPKYPPAAIPAAIIKPYRKRTFP